MGGFMKKIFGAAAIAVASFVPAANAYASCGSNACVGVGDEVLLSVYTNSNGNVYLEIPPQYKGALNCTLVEGVYATLSKDTVLFKEMYASVIYATGAGRKIMVRIAEGSANCQVTYVRVWN